MCSKSAKKKILKIDIRVGNKIRFLSVTIEKRMFQFKCGKYFNLGKVLLCVNDKYRVPSQLALKTHKNFGYAASLATLDKL
jgi:hypothetical protein